MDKHETKEIYKPGSCGKYKKQSPKSNVIHIVCASLAKAKLVVLKCFMASKTIIIVDCHEPVPR